MNITTREATAGDTRSVAELFDLYRQFYEQPADLPRATAFIAERINRKESVILLATSVEVGPVGFCQLCLQLRFYFLRRGAGFSQLSVQLLVRLLRAGQQRL